MSVTGFFLALSLLTTNTTLIFKYLYDVQQDGVNPRPGKGALI